MMMMTVKTKMVEMTVTRPRRRRRSSSHPTQPRRSRTKKMSSIVAWGSSRRSTWKRKNILLYPPAEPPAVEYEHHSTGTAGGGKIYLSDIDQHVKLDRIGTTYRVGLDGSKEIRGSPRPKGDYTPKGWRALPLKERDVIIRREKLREEPKTLEGERKKKEAEKNQNKPNMRREGEREREARTLLSARTHPKVKGKTHRWSLDRMDCSEQMGSPVNENILRWSRDPLVSTFYNFYMVQEWPSCRSSLHCSKLT